MRTRRLWANARHSWLSGDGWRLQLSGTCELWPKLTVEGLRTPEASVVTAPRLPCPTAPSHREHRYSRRAGLEAACRYRRFRAARMAAPMTAAVQDPKSTAILT
jgi:hypothetical protein